MVHNIISSIDLSLQNATIIASISGFTNEEATLVNQYILEVLAKIDILSLSDKEKLTYLKLYVKFRGKEPKTIDIDIDDYVSRERQELIKQL